MKVRLHFFIWGILGFLTGCTGLNPERYLFNKQSYMLSEGHPPAYVAGYVDGCSAGRRLGGDNRFVYRKNNTRFDKDALYAQGWQEGQINCRNEALAENVQPVSKDPSENKKSKKAIEKTADTEARKHLESENQAAEEEMRQIWEELRK